MNLLGMSDNELAAALVHLIRPNERAYTYIARSTFHGAIRRPSTHEGAPSPKNDKNRKR